MRTFVLCLIVFCLSCKKEEMAATHPQYSFVRLNEDGFSLSDCDPDVNKCLPVQYLDDISFQLITDFDTDAGRNFLVAFPCQDNVDNAANVYTDLFGTPVDITGTGTFSGYVTYTISGSHGLSVGDVIYVTATVSSGTNIKGFQKVREVLSASSFMSDIAGSSVATNMKYWQMPDGYIFSYSSTLIPPNSEFSGTNYAWNMNNPTGSTLVYEPGDCFSLCVWHMNINATTGAFNTGFYLGSTNCFTVVQSNCFTTKLEYGCNEDAFGFYGQGFFNSIRLPMYLSRGQYDSDEKGYQKSNGQFVKLAERVNKTYELRTDWMPEQWHDRLRVALSCDTVQVTNENANITEVAIYKKDEYEIEWDGEIDFPLARGKAKVFKALFAKSVNSNCV